MRSQYLSQNDASDSLVAILTKFALKIEKMPIPSFSAGEFSVKTLTISNLGG
jgi:hypothetical protein